MGLLLDTHAIIWYLEGDQQLSEMARIRLDDRDERRCVSVISIWEIAVKINVGKLEIKKPFDELERFLIANAFEWLPLNFEHAQRYLNLPLFHRDPFDRMLIAQAITEGLTIVTRDPHFPEYGIPILW